MRAMKSSMRKAQQLYDCVAGEAARVRRREGVHELSTDVGRGSQPVRGQVQLRRQRGLLPYLGRIGGDLARDGRVALPYAARRTTHPRREPESRDCEAIPSPAPKTLA